VFSVSADSLNLVHAATSARRRGLTVLGVLGRPGQLHRYSRVAVVIGGDSYGRAEDVQLSVCHILTSYVHQCHEDLHHA
jgi:D-sedoheptulose 7-phosphate isomerase